MAMITITWSGLFWQLGYRALLIHEKHILQDHILQWWFFAPFILPNQCSWTVWPSSAHWLRYTRSIHDLDCSRCITGSSAGTTFYKPDTICVRIMHVAKLHIITNRWKCLSKSVICGENDMGMNHRLNFEWILKNALVWSIEMLCDCIGRQF